MLSMLSKLEFGSFLELYSDVFHARSCKKSL
jgi:hypothetical protein